MPSLIPLTPWPRFKGRKLKWTPSPTRKACKTHLVKITVSWTAQYRFVLPPSSPRLSLYISLYLSLPISLTLYTNYLYNYIADFTSLPLPIHLLLHTYLSPCLFVSLLLHLSSPFSHYKYISLHFSPSASSLSVYTISLYYSLSLYIPSIFSILI